MLKRREFDRRTALGLFAVAPLACGRAIAEPLPPIAVWKDPFCGCCAAWVGHLREHGFAATVTEIQAMRALKTRLGVPDTLQSCHTAEVAGYVIEGHVPAAAIRRLIERRPAATGLAVPLMPAGSPGMGGAPEPFDVILFAGDRHERFARFLGDREL
jgi:hypothetical protein